MPEFQLSPVAQQWVNVVLIWVGFGALAGLLAKALLPLRRPTGSIPTLVLGIVGSVVGLLVLSLIFDSDQFNPLSPIGFLAATGGAFLLLILYRVLLAAFGKEEQDAG